MLYDLAEGPPPPGSLLESAFLLLTKRRQESELLKLNVVISAIMAPHQEKSDLAENFKELVNVMFPFIQGEKNQEERSAKESLKRWSEAGAFRVRALGTAQDNQRLASKLRKGAERVKAREEARKKTRTTRLK